MNEDTTAAEANAVEGAAEGASVDGYHIAKKTLNDIRSTMIYETYGDEDARDEIDGMKD